MSPWTQTSPLRRTLTACLAGLLLHSSLAPLASADRLITTDKRIIDLRKARQVEDGTYVLTFENGVIECGPEHIASVEVEGDMSDYVPKNDKERDFLEKGYVRYKDRWMSKQAYQAELNKEAKARRERVEELEAHANFYDGWVKETKHFIVKTNTSPELLDYYCNLMEAYYDLMNKRVGIKPTPTLRRTKMKVNIYKSRSEFTELSGMPPGVAGFFSSSEQSLSYYHDYDEPESSDWIALHECTHLLTYLIEPQSFPQIWVNEGVADYFGSATITEGKRGKLEIEPGKLQVDRILTVQQAIEDDSYVPLEELFVIDRGAFGAFEYAHAWSFVYFLNNSRKEYAKGFNKFFKKNYTYPKDVNYETKPAWNQQGVAKIVPPAEVRRILLAALKVKDDEVKELEKEWLEFISSIEIDAPAARFKRAYQATFGFGTSEMDTDEALADVDFAIGEGLDDPRAYWTRSRLRNRKGDRSGAIEDAQKAIEMAPLDPRFRANLGRLLARRVVFVTGSGGATAISSSDAKLHGEEEDIERAREQYGLAHELDPDNDSYRFQFEDFLEAYDEWKAEQDEG